MSLVEIGIGGPLAAGAVGTPWQASLGACSDKQSNITLHSFMLWHVVQALEFDRDNQCHKDRKTIRQGTCVLLAEGRAKGFFFLGC